MYHNYVKLIEDINKIKLISIFSATGFFTSLIYFLFFNNLYTPIEIVFYTVIISLLFKGFGHFILSFLVSLIDLKTIKETILNEKTLTDLDMHLLNDKLVSAEKEVTKKD